MAFSFPIKKNSENVPLSFATTVVEIIKALQGA